MGKKTDQISLTDDQKQFVKDNWDKIPLIDLAQQTFKDSTINGHNAEARAIKTFIASFADDDEIKSKLKTTKFQKADDIVFTEEQKTMMKNNCTTMKPLECAKLLFKNPSLAPLSLEFKAVSKFYQDLDPTNIPREDRMVDDVEYKPPISIARMIPRVNKYYIKNVGGSGKFLDPDNLRSDERKNCQALLDNMNTERFVQQCSKYYKAVDRELFESSFIRYCYDKPDLMPEEVDTYVSACAETVTVSKIERIIESMEDQLESMLNGTEDGKRLSVTFVDAIKNQRDQLDKSKKMQKSFMDDLTVSRSKRLQKTEVQTASILNLVEAVKSEEIRMQILKRAEIQKQLEADEVNNLSDMDSVIALIAGVNKDRAKYG